MLKMIQEIRRFNWQLIFGLLLLLIIASCSSVQPLQNQPKNFSFKYNPSANPLNVKYTIYHQDDTVSQVYFSIETGNLGFLPIKDVAESYAYLELRAEIFREGPVPVALDTFTYQIKLLKQDLPFYISNFPLKLVKGVNYRINISCLDRFRSSSTFDVMMVNRTDSLHHQNYLIRKSGSIPVIGSVISLGDSVQISSMSLKSDSLYVSVMSRKVNQQDVPFGASRNVLTELKTDSIFTLAMDDGRFYHPDRPGIYQFSTDPARKSGVCILVTSPFFPEIKEAKEYLPPLKYLMSNREFRELMLKDQPKAALDSFWLSANPTLARAKELIRIYYGRAIYANRFFSLSSEGWSSDRGMIYLIFGPPRTVLISALEERWIYGDTGLPSLDFTFLKVEVPGFGADYILNRQEIYKSSWYQAVDSWRNGRAYSIY